MLQRLPKIPFCQVIVCVPLSDPVMSSSRPATRRNGLPRLPRQTTVPEPRGDASSEVVTLDLETADISYRPAF